MKKWLFWQKKKVTDREKLEERRREALAAGRKFKYPLQYAKHRLVINTILIAMVSLGAVAVVVWGLLYKAQSTSDALYRLTRIVPIPVAEVDGEPVLFSDYLMIYKSSILPLEQQGQLENLEKEKAVQKTYKRMALDVAENYTYALKLGRELGLEIDEGTIDRVSADHRKVGGVERSENSFRKIVKDNFGLSQDEYRRLLYLSLTRAEVSKRIDAQAEKIVDAVEKRLGEEGNNMEKVAGEMGEDVQYEKTDALVDIKNIDGGRAREAGLLEVGQVSGRFLSTNADAYYIVKLIAKTEREVNYESIRVPMQEFDRRMKEVREGNKVKEYIDLGKAEELPKGSEE